MDLLDYIQYFSQQNSSVRIFEELMPTIHENAILYQVSDNENKDRLSSKILLLKDYLAKAGIQMEIQIEVLNGETTIPAVNVRAHQSNKHFSSLASHPIQTDIGAARFQPKTTLLSISEICKTACRM